MHDHSTTNNRCVYEHGDGRIGCDYEESGAISAATQRKMVAYVRAIRNARKRAYAERYLEWLLRSKHPSNESVRDDGLSYMGAQAVRLRMADLMEADEP